MNNTGLYIVIKPIYSSGKITWEIITNSLGGYLHIAQEVRAILKSTHSVLHIREIDQYGPINYSFFEE